MTIINKLTIGKRLIFGFAGVILITLCLSVYAFTRLQAIQSQASSLTKDSLPGAVSMGEIATLGQSEIALVLQHIKANDAQEVQKLDEELRDNHEKLSTLFKAYEATIFGAEEAERFRKLTTTYAAYLAPYEDVLKLSRVQKDKEAYELYDQQLQPVFKKFLEEANDDVAYNRKAAETSVKKLNTAAAESKVVLIVGIILSLVLAGLICYSVVRAIRQPLAKMIDLMADIRIGNFTRRLALRRNDELGELADGFDRMSDDLTNLVGQVQRWLFAPGLVEWLSGHSHLPIRLACEGDSVRSGNVLVAGSDDHLVFKNTRELGYTADPKENPYRPSVDVFFESAARFFRGAMTGVLLTGMGRDGAQGLKVLRDAGYHTIAQDKNSSAVFGMPKAAAALNAASEILPLEKIGPLLRELFGSEVKTTPSKRRQWIGDGVTSTNKPRLMSKESDERD